MRLIRHSAFLPLNHRCFCRRAALLATIAALFGFAAQLQVCADTINGTGWKGQGANNNWSTANNWDSNPPTTGGTNERNLFYGQGYFNAGNNGFTTSNNNLSGWNGYRITFQDISGQPDVSFTITGNGFTLFDFGGNFPKIENLSNVTQTFTLTSGQTITLSGGGTGKTEINPVNGNIVFSSGTKVQLNSPLDIFGNFGNTLTFNDVVSGSNPITLKQNSTLVLNAANTYTGNTNIQAGTVLVGANAPSGSAGALGNSTNAVTLGDSTGSVNASLLTNGAFTVGRAIEVRSGNTGTMTIGGNTAAASTYSGNISLGTASGTAKSVTLVAATGGSVEFSGVIDENTSVPASNVTVGSATHTGTVKLSNAANAYNGTTTILGGTLLVGANAPSGSAGALGNASSAVLLGNTSGSTNASLLTDGAFTVGRAITVQSGNSGTMTIGGNTAAASTYSGNINLGSGGSAKNVTLVAATGGFVEFSGKIDDPGLPPHLGSNVTIGSATHTGTVRLSNVNSYGGFVGGITTINGVVLEIATLQPGGTGSSIGSSVSDASRLLFNGGTLRHFSGNSNLTDRSFTFNENGATLDGSGVNPMQFVGAGSLVASGSGNRTLSLIGSTGGQLANVIPDPSVGVTSLVKDGNGTWTLYGANTYTGTTTINAGTLSLSGGAAIANASAVTLTNAAGATLNLNNSETIGSLSGGGASGGNVTLGANTLTTAATATTTYAGVISGAGGGLTVGANNNLKLTGANTYTGATTINSAGSLQLGDGGTSGSLSTSSAITNNGSLTVNRSNAATQGTDFSGTAITGTGSLTKSGTGKLTLTAANTYGGGTTINGGTLLANNTSGSATGTGAVTVAGGGTLAGNGAISGAVTVNGGGTLAPGTSIDSLDVGALTFSADGNGGSTFAVEINTNVAFSMAADLLNANGNLNIAAGAILSLTDAGNTDLANGTKFTLISYAGTWDGGIFLNRPDDSLVTVGVNDYMINYDDTTGGLNFGGGSYGNYVTLTAVPEASAFLFGGLGCLIAGLIYSTRKLRRRRAVAASCPRS
jgi:autotransporter-associated beta strand protein